MRAPRCLPRDFRQALRLLGWSQTEAAVKLGVSSEYRVSDWCRGALDVPPYIQAHLRTLLGLGPLDPWPQPTPTRHEVVLPPSLRSPFVSSATRQPLTRSKGADGEKPS